MFSLTFPVLCKFTFPIFWELYGFLLHPKYLRNPLLWNVCVFPYFPFTMGFTFPYFGNFMGFYFTQNTSQTQHFGMLAFFPYFSRIMGIHFYHTLGIVWISASSEIFKKPINFKCLCFPILFPYNGNSLFPCFGNFRNT